MFDRFLPSSPQSSFLFPHPRKRSAKKGETAEEEEESERRKPAFAINGFGSGMRPLLRTQQRTSMTGLLQVVVLRVCLSRSFAERVSLICDRVLVLADIDWKKGSQAMGEERASDGCGIESERDAGAGKGL